MAAYYGKAGEVVSSCNGSDNGEVLRCLNFSSFDSLTHPLPVQYAPIWLIMGKPERSCPLPPSERESYISSWEIVET